MRKWSTILFYNYVSLLFLYNIVAVKQHYIYNIGSIVGTLLALCTYSVTKILEKCATFLGTVAYFTKLVAEVFFSNYVVHTQSNSKIGVANATYSVHVENLQVLQTFHSISKSWNGICDESQSLVF